MTPTASALATVTLETKCWDEDWEFILFSDRLTLLHERNAHPFQDRVLIINNVSRPDRVSRHAQQAVDEGRIDRYVVVEEYAAAALEFFGLSASGLGRGYVYSIAELVGIYTCRSDYLLHFAGDCLPDARCEWVAAALALMSGHPAVRVANLAWQAPGSVAHASVAREAELGCVNGFYLGRGFSDQCYLIRVADFKDRIYGHSHPASERYPRYGGELFEKRVDAWMRNTGLLRATCSFGSYHHIVTQPHSLRRAAGWLRRGLGLA